MSLKIIGTGRGLPLRQVSNDELATFLDTSDEWISSRTGIQSRPICTSETLTDLATAAAQQALANAALRPADIDVLICATIEGDFRTPSLAYCVSERLGLTGRALDLNTACTGFIYALDLASLYLEQQKAHYVLIVCAEMMSKHTDWTDRSTCVLFGDGAAACVATQGQALRYLNLITSPAVSILNLPSGSGNSPFASQPRPDGFLHMDGQEVFKFAVNAVLQEIAQVTSTLSLAPEQIDYYLLHQANGRIIDAVRSHTDLPVTKFPRNIAHYGNISAVTIPLLLSEMLDEQLIKAGDILFMAAFGAGMSVGSCVLFWE